MKKGLYILLLLGISLGYAQEKYKQTTKLMGCVFDITVVANNKKNADEYINLAIDEIKRIERLISSWDPNSQTSLINRHAGIAPVKVDNELYELIQRSTKLSMLTNGAFDISYASMDRIWKFDGSVTKLPSKEVVTASVAKVGFKNIVFDTQNQTVYLKKKGMRIGFGAIGKGYAADKAKSVLEANGVKGGIINASGDLCAWGTQPNGKPWKIGVTNPLNKNKIFSWFDLTNKAVVTSGNYEKFLMIEGQRYAHIINPKTGYPSTGILSVSVFAPKAELADALATSIFVQGVDVGIDMVNQLAGIECIIVDDQGQVHYSKEMIKTKI